MPRVAADLEHGDFLSGCDAGRWRIVSYEFPILDFAISATEPDGDRQRVRIPGRAVELPRSGTDGSDLGP